MVTREVRIGVDRNPTLSLINIGRNPLFATPSPMVVSVMPILNPLVNLRELAGASLPFAIAEEASRGPQGFIINKTPNQGNVVDKDFDFCRFILHSNIPPFPHVHLASQVNGVGRLERNSPGKELQSNPESGDLDHSTLGA